VNITQGKKARHSVLETRAKGSAINPLSKICNVAAAVKRSAPLDRNPDLKVM
jgi:hypothetical protein